ncbi:MAG: WYL domain-containing protein [Chloroflexi bacterium]|nr:WYL domain-containing protein [Chloroflexota bacterium]
MNRIVNKTTRLQEIEALLIAHPEGLTLTEIARRLGVHRTTISRNLHDVQAPIYEENGKLYLDRRGYLVNLRLSLHEALAVHLASRLLAANLDRQNAHAAAALRKISQAISPLAPELARHIAGSAEEIDELARYDNPTYMRVLETLTEGWASGYKVRVWHRKAAGAPLSCTVFSPYFIEPGAWGRATYVIGLREPPGEIRTLKIERIEQAELLRERYEIPPEFNPYELLADAWGIWYTDEEPVEVVLRFSPRVAGRVRETHWHPSQQLENQPDGSVIWRAKVAEPKEMLYWVRGWGADVQVVEPAALCAEMAEVARAMAEQYGWQVSPADDSLPANSLT